MQSHISQTPNIACKSQTSSCSNLHAGASSNTRSLWTILRSRSVTEFFAFFRMASRIFLDGFLIECLMGGADSPDLNLRTASVLYFSKFSDCSATLVVSRAFPLKKCSMSFLVNVVIISQARVGHRNRQSRLGPGYDGKCFISAEIEIGFDSNQSTS